MAWKDLHAWEAAHRKPSSGSGRVDVVSGPVPKPSNVGSGAGRADVAALPPQPVNTTIQMPSYDFGPIANAITSAANTANQISANSAAAATQANREEAALNRQWQESMWNKDTQFSAEQAQLGRDWQEKMWQKTNDFNSAEAEKSRDWQKMMSDTAYQRAIADMQKAGINPIAAFQQGGASFGSGATATAGTPSSSTASGSGVPGGATGSAHSFQAQQPQFGTDIAKFEYLANSAAALVKGLVGISSLRGNTSAHRGRMRVSEQADRLRMAMGLTARMISPIKPMPRKRK